jgi:hypothetical protein
MLLPANLPQRLISQLIISHNIIWGLAGIMADSELSPPLSPGCIPRTAGWRSHQVPMDSLICSIHPSGELALRPWMHKGTHWGEGTNLGALLFVLVRTWVQIQACLRRQKGSLITSKRPLVTACWGETMSLWFKEWDGSIVPYKSV